MHASGGPGTGPSALRKYGVLPAKLALTALVTWFVLRAVGLQWAEVGEVDWAAVRVDVPLVLLSFVALFVDLVLTAWFWSRIVAQLGGGVVRVPAAASVIILANLGRYVPGKVLQIAGVAVLAGRAGCSAATATAASLVCQMMHLVGAALVGGWAALRYAGVSPQYAVVVGLLALAALGILARFRCVERVLGWALRRSRGRAESGSPPQSLDGFRPWPWLGAFAAKWFVLGLALFLLAQGLGLDAPFVLLATVFAGGYLMGYVVLFAPAGVGVREASMIAMLAPALGLDAGVVVAVAQRAWITAFELLWVPVGAVLLRKPRPR